MRVSPQRSLATRDGEEAVAQPAGPLARGAIHEDVEGVLAEGLAARGEQAVEALIAGGEMRLPDAGAGVFAEIQVLHLAIAFEHDELQVAQRVRLEGFQLVGARLQFVSDDVDAAQALEVHIAVGEDFVEGEEQARLAAAADLRADEAGEVAAEIHDLPAVGWQDLRFARCPGLVDGMVGGVGDGLQFEGRDGLQVLLRVTAELGADAGEGAVLPGVVHLEAGPDLALGDEPRRLADDVIGIINAAGQQRLAGWTEHLTSTGGRAGVRCASGRNRARGDRPPRRGAGSCSAAPSAPAP